MEAACGLDFFFQDMRKRDTSIDFHTHTGFELVYYTSGQGTTTLGKQKYNYKKGNFSIIEPNCPHDEYRELDTGVICMVFHFNNIPFALGNHLYSDIEGQPIKALLQKISKELMNKNSFSSIMIRCHLMELIVQLGRISGTRFDEEEPEDRLLYAKSYIEQYAATDRINLPGLASTLGYSYDYFRHLFKEFTGLAPMPYIMKQRFRKAELLLCRTKDTITSIALDCGFSNAPQFCSLFKKEYGVSPLQYREQSKLSNQSRSNQY